MYVHTLYPVKGKGTQKAEDGRDGKNGEGYKTTGF